MCYITETLVPLSVRLKLRSLFSTFSIIPFTLSCVASVLVSYPFRHALIKLRFRLSTFSIDSFTLNCVTSVPIWHPFRHALKYAVICPISFIYPELCYISASLAPFLARLKIRSDLSSFSIMPFTVSCVTPVPVLTSHLFRHELYKRCSYLGSCCCRCVGYRALMRFLIILLRVCLLSYAEELS